MMIYWKERCEGAGAIEMQLWTGLNGSMSISFTPPKAQMLIEFNVRRGRERKGERELRQMSRRTRLNNLGVE